MASATRLLLIDPDSMTTLVSGLTSWIRPMALSPLAWGEAHIEQARVRLVLAGSLHRFVGVKGRRHDRVPPVSQGHAQRVEQQPVVVTEQQPHEAISPVRTVGSAIRAAIPLSAPGLSSNAPPQAATRARVMVNPSELLLGTFPSPGPSSMILMVISSSVPVTSTVTCPPGPAARTALSSTQVMARPSATGVTTVDALSLPKKAIRQVAVGSARCTQRYDSSATSTRTGGSSAAPPMTASTMSDSH